MLCDVFYVEFDKGRRVSNSIFIHTALKYDTIYINTMFCQTGPVEPAFLVDATTIIVSFRLNYYKRAYLVK